MTNEPTELGLQVRGEAKDCYNSEQERLDHYATLLSTGVNQGEKGATGTQGNTGAQGPQGEKGDKGDPGIQGPQGSPGTVVDDSGFAVFDNGATSVTITGKDLTGAFFSLYTIDQTLGTHPQNLTTAINKVDLVGSDTVVTITVAAFDESPTVAPQSNLGLRWILFNQA